MIADAWRQAVPKLLRPIWDRARENLSGRLVRVRSGKLRATVVAGISGAGSRSRLPVGHVGSNHPIAHILEGGARPHEIRGTHGPLLLRVFGRWIRKDVIHHPGVRPRRWLATAAEESLGDLDRLLLAEYQQTFERRLRAQTPAPAKAGA